MESLLQLGQLQNRKIQDAILAHFVQDKLHVLWN